MPRFHVPLPLALQDAFRLPENTVRHIQVLRLNAGDAVILFNGTGSDFDAVLEEVGRRHALCRIIAQRQPENESPLRITLAQAVSSAEHMDYTIQKSVELGVARIQPVISTRSAARLSAERTEKRTRRWQDIAISACEQSGRSIIPEVLPPLPFTEYLRQAHTGLRLIASLNRAQTLAATSTATPSKSKKAVLLAGPEGGWTAEEEAAAAAAGFTAVSLGPRVLRTETAASAAIAAMQALWGDWR